MNQVLRPGSLLLLVSVFAVSSSRLRGDEVPLVSALDLEESEQLVGQRLELEGRVASRGPDRLHLVGTDLDFRFTPSPRIPRFRLQRVKLAGTLRRQGAKLRFEIDELHTLPSEQEEFLERRRRIRNGAVQAWYDLGQWARQRAVLYQDDALSQLADEAYRDGLSADERRAGENPDALLALSRYANDVARLPGEAERLTARAFRIRAAGTAEDDVAGLEALARQIAAALPGSEEPLANDDRELSKRAARNPDKTYHEVTDSRRRKLHRILWADVMERALTASAQEAPAEGVRLARRATRLIPERPELADRLKRRGLEEQARRAPELSRRQVIEMAAGYRSLLAPEPERAREILRAWTAARRRELGAQDAEGRLALARDVMSLLEDRQQAVTLLNEAWKLAPDLSGLAEELEGLGLVRVGSHWIEPENARRHGDQEMERLIRLGKVARGMTEAQVLRSLHPPDQVTRVAGSEHVLEQWVFAGAVPLRVNLVRHRRSGLTEVISVHSGR